MCCADLSNETLAIPSVTPKPNINFWSEDPAFNESRWNEEVAARGGSQAARLLVMEDWKKRGVRFAQGMVARQKLLPFAIEVRIFVFLSAPSSPQLAFSNSLSLGLSLALSNSQPPRSGEWRSDATACARAHRLHLFNWLLRWRTASWLAQVL